MERNMIGKNAWGLSIRPCDKGYEFTVECGLIERINKTMDKAKIKGQAFPETHIFMTEVEFRDFLTRQFTGYRFIGLSANQIFAIHPSELVVDEWGDYEIHDDVWGGTYAVENNHARGESCADTVIAIARQSAVTFAIPRQYRINYPMQVSARRCPNCDSVNIEYDDSDLDPLYGSWQRCTCEECRCDWTEHYEAIEPSKITINNKEDVYKEDELFDE